MHLADGIAVGLPGQVPFETVQRYVGDVRTVGEDSLSKALLLVLERAKLVVEPAGAAAVAAVLDEPKRFKPPVVAVLSGGNIDPLLLMRVIRHGMAAAGRYLSLRVRIPDTPGGLARRASRSRVRGPSPVLVTNRRRWNAFSVSSPTSPSSEMPRLR